MTKSCVLKTWWEKKTVPKNKIKCDLVKMQYAILEQTLEEKRDSHGHWVGGKWGH